MIRILSVLCFVLFAGCVQVEPAMCGQGPVLAEGDHWVRADLEEDGDPGRSYQNVTAVGENITIEYAYLDLATNEAMKGAIDVCKGGWAATFVHGDNQWESGAHDPCGALRFPVRVGDEYSETCGFVHTSHRIEAHETVTVPAGTFDTIRYNITWDRGENPSFETRWYAEEACTHVKSEFYDGDANFRVSGELIAYRCAHQEG